MQQFLQFIIWRLKTAEHVSGVLTSIFRSSTTAVAASGFTVGCVVIAVLDADSVQQQHVQQPSTYAKPEAASAVLGSWWWAVCRPKHVELHINMK